MRPNDEIEPPTTLRYVSYPDLKKFGIGYCRVHLRRLIDRGEFPAPVKLSKNRIAWRYADVVVWMASRETTAA